AEDGIRAPLVTGVQTCALPISPVGGAPITLAERLAEAAPPGVVVAGSATAQLLREVARVEPLASLVVRGHEQPVPVFRIAGVNEIGRASCRERREDGREGARYE